MKDENRLLLILRDWEKQGLTLSVKGDKIRSSGPVSDDKRELIIQYRDLIMSLMSKMTFRTKKECMPHLRAWYEKTRIRYKITRKGEN